MRAGVLRGLKPLLLLVGLLGAWQIASIAFQVPTFLLPSPLEILARIAAIPDRLAYHSLVTLSEVLAGFALAVVVGVGLAVVIVHSRFLAESLYPLLVISQVVPQVAVAPLLVIWFGHGALPKILIAFLVSFFPMVVNTSVGLLRVDPDLLDLIRGLKASRWQVFHKIRLPNALPYMFTGMRVSITLAVIGAVVGEFVGASEGLGYLVFTGVANLDTRLTFAGIAVLAAMGITLFWLVGVAQRLALPWASTPAEDVVT